MKRIILLIFLVIFGLLTLFMSSSVLFDWFGIRAKEGNFVPFIVWTNWLCGFLYLTAAYGIFKNKTWSKIPLITGLIILILAYIGLFIHIEHGGLYENKTLGAMAFRIGVTTVFLLITTKIFKK
ncbi:MAG: hypothetical protein L6264_08335 [Weeksellaceae bacterium]|nr:hypothetical protein [Bacteroidota bacterium]MCG2780944.1 hypothetical protein [Weeksellaceae bacterium]